MNVRHRPNSPHPAPSRRANRGGRPNGGGRASFGYGRFIRASRGMQIGRIGDRERLLLFSAPANDNQPSLRWRLARLGAALGILSACAGLVLMIDR